MKRMTILAVLALWCAAGYGQTLLHPFGGAGGGGGLSSGGGFSLLGTAGQAAAGYAVDADTGMIDEGGIIPPLRQGSGATHTSDVLVQAAWNMISIPVIPPDPTKTVLLPTAISSAFIYLPPPSGYANEDTLLPGTGFWVKFPGVQTLTFTGTGQTLDTIPVNAGWNLIGSLTYPLLTGDVTPLGGVTVLSSYFAFLGGFGYYTEDTLRPGRAYWVKVSMPGYIVLRSGSVLIEPSAPPGAAGVDPAGPEGTHTRAIGAPEGTAALSFRDAAGQERELYVGVMPVKERPDAYELPPPPPGGIFDVRFADNTILGGGAGAAAQTGSIVRISGGEWPVEIRLSGGPAGAKVNLAVVSGTGEQVHELSAGSALTLDRPALVTVRAGNLSGTDDPLPSEYRLYQNYPNPFNPSTAVRFDLPEAAHVTLLLTDALGRSVRKVLDGQMEAGRHAVEIDGKDLPTGVYFYRMTAGNYSDTRKMLLMK